MQTKSIGGMPCSCMAAAWAGLSRTASRPPWILGCRVLIRPSIISGKPVTSATSVTGSLHVSRRYRAVPPVLISSTPNSLTSAAANALRPVLSDTEIRARLTGTRSDMKSSRLPIADPPDCQSPTEECAGARLDRNPQIANQRSSPRLANSPDSRGLRLVDVEQPDAAVREMRRDAAVAGLVERSPEDHRRRVEVRAVLHPLLARVVQRAVADEHQLLTRLVTQAADEPVAGGAERRRVLRVQARRPRHDR